MSAPQPSFFGYNAIPTVHRESKQAIRNRETREKLMVTGTIPSDMNPLRSTPTSAGIISEQERFRKDAPSFLHDERNAKIQHDNARIAYKSHKREERLEVVAEKNSAASEKYERESRLLAGSSIRGKESVGYNLISGVYSKPDEAEKQRQKESRMARAVHERTERLSTKINSTSYNIITGEPRN